MRFGAQDILYIANGHICHLVPFPVAQPSEVEVSTAFQKQGDAQGNPNCVSVTEGEKGKIAYEKAGEKEMFD